MSEEEKEAIMKNLIIISNWSDKIVDDETLDNVSKLLDIVLMFQTENVKQEKEIKELKDINQKIILGKFREVANKNNYIKDNYISKDKIRKKLEEYRYLHQANIENKDNMEYEECFNKAILYTRIIWLLQELLGE